MPLAGLAQKKILPEEQEQGYQICDLMVLVNNVVSVVVIGIIPLIAASIIAWAGFRMITNQGDADIAKQSRAILIAVVIGLVVMYGGWAIVSAILAGMGYNYDWPPKCN